MKDVTGKTSTLRKNIFGDQLKKILFLGILLRVIVYVFQSPFNNDHHFEVVEFIHDLGILPVSNLLSQSYHPPLYYILASLFLPGGAKVVQLFSLILSIGTISIFYWLIRNTALIESERAKKYCLFFACVLPQFVMSGNFISNDTLAIFIGALIFLQIHLYIRKPSVVRVCILAVYLGLGLLTKGSFLAFVPVLMLFVIFNSLKNREGIKEVIIAVVLFAAIFSVIGSYKFIENMIYHDRPMVHNIDANPKWAMEQSPTYVNLRESMLDINLLKLCRYPTVSKETSHSLPLMLYGTFWYQYIPESNFTGNKTQFKYIGSLIYLFAVFPTLLFLIGSMKIIFSCGKLSGDEGKRADVYFGNTVYKITSLALLFANLVLVIIIGMKYDVWSCFQSRLIFPSCFAVILLLNAGLGYIENKCLRIQNFVYFLLRVLFCLFLLYFSVEIVGRGVKLLPPNMLNTVKTIVGR